MESRYCWRIMPSFVIFLPYYLNSLTTSTFLVSMFVSSGFSYRLNRVILSLSNYRSQNLPVFVVCFNTWVERLIFEVYVFHEILMFIQDFHAKYLQSDQFSYFSYLLPLIVLPQTLLILWYKFLFNTFILWRMKLYLCEKTFRFVF